MGSISLDRKAIFGLHCVSSSGERFIVELQKAKQSPYRAMRLLQKQLLCEHSNQWVIYSISVLDTVFASSQEVLHTVQFEDQHGVAACDKLTFIYLTLPSFHKTLDALETLQDRWFYIFRHLHELTEIPAKLQAQVFRKLFEAAQIACFNPTERQAYEDSLKYYLDLKNRPLA